MSLTAVGVAAQTPVDGGVTSAVVVTARDYNAKVLFNGDVAEGDAPTISLTYNMADQAAEGEPVLIELQGKSADRSAAALYLPDAGITLVVNSVQLKLQLVNRGGALSYYFDATADSTGDWIDVYRSPTSAGLPLNVQFSDKSDPSLGVVVAVRGAGRLARAGGGIEVSVADGVFEYTPDRSATTLQSLSAGGENSISVAPGGAITRRSDAGVNQKMNLDRGAIVQRSLLTSFAQVAEETAEGDLQPPSRGSPVTISTTLVVARVTDIVPRGAGFASLARAASSVSSAGAATQSTAEAFLSSNSAALAVVGARLQTTRVIAGRNGALSISGEATPRFTLGRRQR